MYIYIYTYMWQRPLGSIWELAVGLYSARLPVVLGLPFLEGGQEGRHGLCSSDLEKWRSVVMVTTIPLPE